IPLLFFSLLPRSPASTLFPYTTLFRSRRLSGKRIDGAVDRRGAEEQDIGKGPVQIGSLLARPVQNHVILFAVLQQQTGVYLIHRSEEHTSELQSRFDLVCRLLLEKKK